MVSATACPLGPVEASFVPVGNGAVSGYRPDPSDQGSLDIWFVVAPWVAGGYFASHGGVCEFRPTVHSGGIAPTAGFSPPPGGLCGASQGRQRSGPQPDPPSFESRVAITGVQRPTAQWGMAFHCQSTAPSREGGTQRRATQGARDRHDGVPSTRGVDGGHCGTDGQDTTPPQSSPESARGIVKMSLATRSLHWLIRVYQTAVSGRPSPCRYIPTCSSYALDALEQRGFFTGSWLTIRRLARCHPWGGSGWDPVPVPDGCDHHSGAPHRVAHDQRNP